MITILIISKLVFACSPSVDLTISNVGGTLLIETLALVPWVDESPAPKYLDKAERTNLIMIFNSNKAQIFPVWVNKFGINKSVHRFYDKSGWITIVYGAWDMQAMRIIRFDPEGIIKYVSLGDIVDYDPEKKKDEAFNKRLWVEDKKDDLRWKWYKYTGTFWDEIAAPVYWTLAVFALFALILYLGWRSSNEKTKSSNKFNVRKRKKHRSKM